MKPEFFQVISPVVLWLHSGHSFIIIRVDDKKDPMTIKWGLKFSTKERLTGIAVTLVYRLYSQLIQTSGGLQKLLAFAAESNIPEVQQHAVRSFAQA